MVALQEQESLLDLIPTEQAEPEHRDLQLDFLPPDEELLSDPPSPELIRSIREFGVLQPIIVLDKPGAWVVAAGRRRIKAARAAGLQFIPALIYPQDWALHEVLTLVENGLRSNNRQVDVEALEGLVLRGASLADIRRATGMPVGTIKSRLKLLKLIPALRKALREGKLRESAATRAARLSPEQQQRLADDLTLNGKVTGNDVSHAAQVERDRAVTVLPPELFSVEATLDWRKVVQEHLRLAAGACQDEGLQAKILLLARKVGQQE